MACDSDKEIGRIEQTLATSSWSIFSLTSSCSTHGTSCFKNKHLRSIYIVNITFYIMVIRRLEEKKKVSVPFLGPGPYSHLLVHAPHKAHPYPNQEPEQH